MNETVNTVNLLEPPPTPRTNESPKDGAGHAPAMLPEMPSVPPSRPGTLFAWLGRTVPTLLVMGGLAALGWWGHHTGWTMPKFSVLAGNGQAEKDDWCAEHAVAESVCVECRPDLFPKGKEFGWCTEHGNPECSLEHPEVAQLKVKPQVSPDDLARAQRALAFAPRPENSSKCKLHLRRIQFASKEAAAKAGVEVEPVWEAPIIESVSAHGEVTYDPTRVARLSARVPGTLWRVTKQVGDRVQQGEILALVDAAEVGKAKAEFLQALVQVDLKQQTLTNFRAATGAVPERTVQEAEAALQETQIRLLTAQQALVNLGLPIQADDFKGLRSEEIAARVRFLGLPEAITKPLDPKTTTGNLLPLKAPLDGVVVAREAVAGEVVDTAKVLFVVADFRQMWLTLNVRQEDTKKLSLGQPVRFHVDGRADDVQGTIAWISSSVDEKTRTVKVRADLANAEGLLRSNTFGTGRIILREEKKAVVVPNDAIQWEGDCHVVFVRDKNYDPQKADSLMVFHVRKVRPGARNDQYTEIAAGVLPNELVASKGSGVLRSELLKNNLGAG